LAVKRSVKIEKHVQGQTTIIRLVGHFHLDHVEELRKQIGANAEAVLDLEEVTVVDVDVVRFLVHCEEEGMKIAHCPRYVRKWMARERTT
jgi:anti-anti-sigma regulatory factor